MRNFLTKLLLSLALLSTGGCGFHLRENTQIPAEMRTMILNSSDPYGPLARIVRQQLRLNSIEIIEDSAEKRSKVPSLRLEQENTGRDTASIFADGTTAEYQLRLSVTAQVLLPGKGIYPLQATVFRSFYDNNGVPLAKDNEQDMIYQEMRQRAAQQLIRQLIAVHASQQSSDVKLSDPEVIRSTGSTSSTSDGLSSH